MASNAFAEVSRYQIDRYLYCTSQELKEDISVLNDFYKNNQTLQVLDRQNQGIISDRINHAKGSLEDTRNAIYKREYNEAHRQEMTEIYQAMDVKDKIVARWMDSTRGGREGKTSVYFLGAIFIGMKTAIDFQYDGRSFYRAFKTVLRSALLLGLGVEAIDTLIFDPANMKNFPESAVANISMTQNLGDGTLGGAVVELEDEIRKLTQSEKAFNAFMLSNDEKSHTILCYSPAIRAAIQTIGASLNLTNPNVD